jgi:Protein of unknown function (DUF3102)
MLDIDRQNGLATIAEQVNAAHREAQEFLHKGLNRAIDAGNLLLEAKARLKHGEWLPWLDANVECSARTAQAYMRVARYAEELDKNADLSHLSLVGALKMLTAPEPDPIDGVDVDALLTEAHAGRHTFKIPSTIEEATARLEQIGREEAALHLAAEQLRGRVEDPVVRHLRAKVEFVRGILAEIESLAPGIRVLPLGLELPDHLPIETWQTILRLLLVLPGAQEDMQTAKR